MAKRNRGLGCILLILGLFLGIRALSKFNVPIHLGSAASQRPLSEELAPPATPLQEGMGIVVLVDTSGSMQETVPDSSGGKKKKIEIAKDVTRKTFEEIRTFANKNPGKKVFAGLTEFSTHAVQSVPLAPVAQLQTDQAIKDLSAGGNTAIGDALVSGKQQLNKAALKKQFMIVITDGENTTGRSPEEVMTALHALPENQRASIYLIAFDVAAKVFEPLVKQGASVAEAQDAKSLQSALDYILYEKILVEQE